MACKVVSNEGVQLFAEPWCLQDVTQEQLAGLEAGCRAHEEAHDMCKRSGIQSFMLDGLLGELQVRAACYLPLACACCCCCCCCCCQHADYSTADGLVQSGALHFQSERRAFCRLPVRAIWSSSAQALCLRSLPPSSALPPTSL